jgi:hypothetical protein
LPWRAALADFCASLFYLCLTQSVSNLLTSFATHIGENRRISFKYNSYDRQKDWHISCLYKLRSFNKKLMDGGTGAPLFICIKEATAKKLKGKATGAALPFWFLDVYMPGLAYSSAC